MPAPDTRKRESHSMANPSAAATEMAAWQIEEMQKNLAATKLQRWARGVRVRWALKCLAKLQDLVFKEPTPGYRAGEMLTAPPWLPEEDLESEAGGASVAGSRVAESLASRTSRVSRVSRAPSRAGSNISAATGKSGRARTKKDAAAASTVGVPVKKGARGSLLQLGGAASGPGGSKGTAAPAADAAKKGPWANFSAASAARQSLAGSVAASTPCTEDLPPIIVELEMVAGHLEHVDTQECKPCEVGEEAPETEEQLALRAAEEKAARCLGYATAIFWLMLDPDTEEPFNSYHLTQIYNHHRMRRKNAFPRVTLRLTLVVHGATDQSIGSGMAGDPARPMVPEGWLQVARTGWALRLHPLFAPSIVMTSTENSCVQTADRLKTIMSQDEEDSSDSEPDEPEPTPAPKEDAPEGETSEEPREPVIRRPPFPEARLSKELIFPTGRHLGPESYKVQEAMTRAMVGFDSKAGLIPIVDLEEPPEGPPAIMLIGSAFIMETVMAVLTAQSRKMDEAMGRLGGGSRLCPGDAVIMQSHSIVHCKGEEFSETYRLNSELLEDVLKRADWQTIQHIRGSGKPSESPDWFVSADTKKKGSKLDDDDGLEDGQGDATTMEEDGDMFEDGGEDGEDGDRRRRGKPYVRGPIANAFAKYCGEPLIFSHDEFSRLVVRAGSEIRPVDQKTMAALRPLVKDYVLPEDDPDYQADADDLDGADKTFFPAGSGMNAAFANTGRPRQAGADRTGSKPGSRQVSAV
eukprot:TRINITY_DN7820_c0_g1_i2.p1 TRINITY_DN7820_c0_g1~~TRINITY_DN7820_c0_g1_i2.p1  ORF type:complete len:749 (-),score=180.08 TRINITY_DN7820_c0_g1_i2:105-2351(-)